MALPPQQGHSSKGPSTPRADKGKDEQTPFALVRICCLPWCALRAIIREYFVNRGVFAAACSRLGRAGWSCLGRAKSGASALRVLQDRCWWHGASDSHATGLEALCCSSEKVHIPQGGCKGSLSVPECTFTFICGCRGAPTTRCSELPWANAGPQPPHASPSSSKHSPGFHQNDLTSFVVASPKVAHMVETSGCAQPSWIASPRKSPVLDTRNPVCPIPSQDRFAYWVRQVFLAT